MMLSFGNDNDDDDDDNEDLLSRNSGNWEFKKHSNQKSVKIQIIWFDFQFCWRLNCFQSSSSSNKKISKIMFWPVIKWLNVCVFYLVGWFVGCMIAIRKSIWMNEWMDDITKTYHIYIVGYLVVYILSVRSLFLSLSLALSLHKDLATSSSSWLFVTKWWWLLWW